MKNTPINYDIVSQKVKESGVAQVGSASIREIKKLVDNIEKATGDKFIRMEMGIPGIPASQYGVKAQIKALEDGVAAIYPDIQGIPPLKNEISRFVKNFLDVDVAPEGCIPTVGSMQGGFAAFMMLSRIHKKKDTTLFIDPGFPVHKMQHKVLGLKFDTFDVYNYRGEKLREKLEEYFSKGNIHSVIYSNPNNPSWICFTETELQIIGELATKYDVVIMEDLAYFAMDFRKDYSVLGEAPFQPSVAKYTDNYMLFISSSKSFSYAGERIGMMVISDGLYQRKYEDLLRFYPNAGFGYSMIFGTMYPLSSGTSHSTQYGLHGILKAVNDGDYNFRDEVMIYGEKAKVMKKLFLENGFTIVYDKDEGEPIADGFYFTFAYEGFSGVELLNELVYYGISAISLSITGSERHEGVRACVSLVKEEQFADLKYRLEEFNKNNPIG
ncbi:MULTISPECIES: pyridoxal phosphate-dependent aminotransferase [unclassified Lentimicrobium]|uniref:aminotransferase class I/II-fold pyridoxal phosphate-dependent enzyme n=1 Tax=unclassified Lentimicrobium TaxID=2677434 RepID=UPI001555CA6D|nr:MULTISPECIES: pyridoxal phosphate-dependent aminotransferase [unclassified Lentimicrobium]NPD46833.1 pyridoxal phosphate-dependent aminotransferase [Lentimicrobium sp. S6]NPD85121.1 pyridoxal phosphate-dependent aminotransferase [Lentimicrobium sp. L6]